MCGSPGPQRVSCPMLASRFLRRSGSEESIQWEDRPSGASAPSLSRHPMPFRITQESYRPRVSDRTMVGALPTRSACKFQEPNGVDNESCHETVKWEQLDLALRREKAIQTKWQPARGAGCARSSTASGGGKYLLTSPSIGLPTMRLLDSVPGLRLGPQVPSCPFSTSVIREPSEVRDRFPVEHGCEWS